MIRSPRGALLGDTVAGEGFQEGTMGLLAAATISAVVINRVVNRVRRGQRGNEKRTQHNVVRVHTYFFERHDRHDDTTRLECNIAKTTPIYRL